jgi:hypothetical protein
VNAKALVAWEALVAWAELGYGTHRDQSDDIKILTKDAEAEIRANERRLMLEELAEMARELESVRKFTAATIVKEMWNRAVRRRLKP